MNNGRKVFKNSDESILENGFFCQYCNITPVKVIKILLRDGFMGIQCYNLTGK